MSDASIATTNVLAAGDIHVGEHTQITVAGMVYNFDTIYATLVAAAIVLALAFYLKPRSPRGSPTGFSCSGKPSPFRCAARSRARWV